MESEVLENMEVRHLKLSHLATLGSILDERDDWKKLMSVVRIDCDPNKPYKYSNPQDFKAVERAGKHSNPSTGCTTIFLDEWGTSGRIRPKLGDLLKYLEEAQLKQAASIVRVQILNQRDANCDELITTNEQNRVSPNGESHINERNRVLPNGESIVNENDRVSPSEHQHGTYGSARIFSFKEIENITGGFEKKLGSGASGAVYYGKLINGTDHWLVGQEVAVKRFESSNVQNNDDNSSLSMTDNSFVNEITKLSECKHRNLIALVGVCNEPTKDKCLIYEYMCNGSLNDRLLCLNNTQPLRPSTRYDIALGVAKALNYLHTGLDRSYVHMDVKSANILLNENFEPKLGDFGIVKKFSHNNTSVYTETCAGTSAYMPLEQHLGQITTKIDVFSYGIVLLELLTGKCPTAEGEHKLNVYDLFFDQDPTQLPPLEDVLDKKVMPWEKLQCARVMYEIATQKCCKHKREDRDSMQNVENKLVAVISSQT